MAQSRMNLMVFYTDQHRFDSLGCNGNIVAQTRNLDQLAAQGCRFVNHYVSNPVCMPSRASFLTGRFPHASGVFDNGIPLPESAPTLPAVLAEAGYQTTAIGKIHLTPYNADADTRYGESFAVWRAGRLAGWRGPYYGFQKVELTLGHGEAAFRNGAHYGAWVEANFPKAAESVGIERALPPKILELACWRSSLPVEAHHSTFCAERALEFLHEIGDRPFFLFVGFPDPHHPFTPPAVYASRFEGAAFPGPFRQENENDSKPRHYRAAIHQQQHPVDGGAHRPTALSDTALRAVFENTYGMVTLIDESIGHVLDGLEEMGLADRTIVAFTSDHGDLLGDHWMLYKGPYPCRSLMRVPLLIRVPGMEPLACDTPVSCTDAMPTFLDLLGVHPPAGVQGKSLRPILDGTTDHIHEGVLSLGYSKDSPLFFHKSIHTRDWRLTVFPNQNDGELYDLNADPHEFVNLFHSRKHKRMRERLLEQLFWLHGHTDAPAVPPRWPW